MGLGKKARMAAKCHACHQRRTGSEHVKFLVQRIQRHRDDRGFVGSAVSHSNHIFAFYLLLLLLYQCPCMSVPGSRRACFGKGPPGTLAHLRQGLSDAFKPFPHSTTIAPNRGQKKQSRATHDSIPTFCIRLPGWPFSSSSPASALVGIH